VTARPSTVRGLRAAVLFITTIAALVAGCTAVRSAVTPSSDKPRGLVVLAAASLRDPLARLERAWLGTNPGVDLTVSTNSSTALRTQVEQGARADVFLSADTANPKSLADAGLTDGPPVVFAINRLAVIVPADNPAGIERVVDLARPGVKVVAAGEGVPITTYAEQLVEGLGLARGYRDNIVSREDDVRAVVAKIELGEGDAAIVYATDAAGSDKVETVSIADDRGIRATYAGVALSDAPDPQAARAFLEWLTRADAQAVLQEAGFLAPP
jgi:molybdate transport system substrate-binding protein